MIYSGLEFGQYFETTNKLKCDDFMLALQPASRLLFTFFQMYFAFLNAKVNANFGKTNMFAGTQFSMLLFQ